jgi:twitching motility two-component system response regulator PilG
MDNMRSLDIIHHFILVVVINVDERVRTSMLLQQFGYNICTAQTASEAISFLNVARPAGIVADTGSSLLSKMKREPSFSDIPVILLSSSPGRELKDRSRHGESAVYLRTPIKIEELYQVIQSAVEKGPRKYIRINTTLRAKLGGEFEGLVTVLSEDGIFVRALDSRPVNTRMSVSVEIKGRIVELEAAIQHITLFNEEPFKKSGMGMKFVKIAPEDRAFIKTFILEQIDQRTCHQLLRTRA